jgi:hypothetical protein
VCLFLLIFPFSFLFFFYLSIDEWEGNLNAAGLGGALDPIVCSTVVLVIALGPSPFYESCI